MPPTTINLTKEQADKLIELADALLGKNKRDNLYFDKEGIKELVKGVEIGFNAIKGSFGSAGSNIIIEAGLLPGHQIVNDGRIILDSIKLVNPVQQIGLNILKECVKKADEISGDGRKTSAILTHAIIKEGLKCKESPMEIKRSLDECLPIILKSIDEQTKQIRANEVGEVARVASESEELGKLFGEIYSKIGKDGIVELDTGGLTTTTYEITEGVKLLGCGFHYPYMANEDKGRQAVYKNPYILITKQKITNIMQIDPILKYLFNKGHDQFVIFCDEIDVAVSQALYQLSQGYQKTVEGVMRQVKLETLVIKAPTLWKDWIYEDFSKITGATIVDGVTLTLKNVQISQLGSCEKIVTTKDQTIVLGTRDFKEHLKTLEELDTPEAKLRMTRLCTKTAILKLGANSESELSYLKGKALDARNASYLSLQGGIVNGGGVSLSNVATWNLMKLKDKTIGAKILFEALQYPHKLILENSGIKFVSKDIFDPAIVVKNSITNALSVAGTVLTAKAVITLPK